MANNKPIPKTQLEIAQSFVDPLLNTGKSPSVDNKRRELQKTVKNDDVKQFSFIAFQKDLLRASPYILASVSSTLNL